MKDQPETESNSPATRLYAVTPNNGVDSKSRLIEASSQAQALRFVAEGAYRVEVASPKMVGMLMGAGAKIEDASSK